MKNYCLTLGDDSVASRLCFPTTKSPINAELSFIGASAAVYYLLFSDLRYNRGHEGYSYPNQ